MRNFFTPKKLWILNAVLLVVFLALVYVDYLVGGLRYTLFYLTVFLVLVSVLGLIIGLVAANAPYGEKTFREKFKVTFPLAASLTGFTCIVALGFLLYTWWSLVTTERPMVKYDKVEVPANLDCSSLRNGKFKTEFIVFERQGDTQLQRYEWNDKSKAFKVKWISDCEYHLTGIEGNKENFKVKIIAVTDSGYDCYAAEGTYAVYSRCKKIN